MAVNPQIKNLDLRSPKAPNLPIAPVDYRQQYVDQVNNALRLYFNQVDNFSQAVAIPASGTTANRPVGTTQAPLLIGQIYYDTTLDRPIWWNGTVWKKADGVTV
jgi:hypothetical protein